MTPEEMRLSAILAGMDSAEYHGIDTALSAGTPFKVCPVKDTAGQPLQQDNRYKFNGKLIRVQRWEFGSGNLLDTYYRVFYLDCELRDRMTVIAASYKNGILNGAVYQSEFEPID